jgi:phosphohistidine phosphatase
MIVLLRHGDAVRDAVTDAARPLTPEGERQARAAGAALSALGVELERCLTSPKVRALETARLACEELGLDYELEEELAGGIFDPVELAAGRDVLLIVHEPDLSSAIAAATGARVKLEKGGLAVIAVGSLVSLLRPAELAAIAGAPSPSPS